ncbi:excinuclease ABC subunit UvrC [Candidatus Gracilibacteria bacterium]|nr:excinuclease ABC subunit UvrC [Candidatus Gracilibacteria bacterium]
MNDLKNILKNIPKLPGIYQFLNKNGKIIYIGKSVKLHSRVNSYFNGTKKLNFAKQKMVGEIYSIKTIITNNGVESLLLETNLIKKHKPKYNILMKDDKNQLYIKITNEIFPKVIKTRIKTNSGIYFGPYISSNYVNNILKILKKIYGYRDNNIKFEKDKNGKIFIKSLNGAKIPSLEYYIGTCSGPCTLKEENMKKYDEGIENIKKFLSGDFEKLLKDLKIKMLSQANSLNFEEASKTKEYILSIESLKENQIVRDLAGGDQDIINYLEKYDKLYLSKIEVRNQKINGIYNFEIDNKLFEIDESIRFFIENNYLTNSVKLNLILPKKIEIEDDILKNLNLNIEIPKIGEKTDLLNLAYKNAFEFGYKSHISSLSTKGFTQKNSLDLLNLLGYKQINKNIIFECNDISHIYGSYTTASRSVMEGGKLTLQKYKKFKIKTLNSGEINDYLSHQEIAKRRYLELKKLKNIPDLIIIDGGKGQLSSIFEVLEKTKNEFKDDLEFISILEKLQYISLAEKEEEIFLPGKKTSIKLDKDDILLKLIQKLRDEAHRFAVNFTQTLRGNKAKKNILEEIPGIGPKTRIKLLKHYGNIDELKEDDFLINTLKKPQIEALKEHGII